MWQVRLIGRQEGTQTNNVLNFTTVAAGADVETELILVMINCFVTNILPQLSSSWSLQEVRWKKTSPTLGVEQITVPTGTTTGGVSGSAYPTFVSALISIRTLLGGRTHRGRMFLAGLPESAAANSVIDDANAFWTALLAWLVCIASNFIFASPPGGTGKYQLGVYSRKTGGSTFPYGPSGFTAVSSLIPSQILATTRSRKFGRGA